MKKIVIPLFLIFITSQLCAQKVNWLSFEDAISLNKENPKPILIDIYTDWCGYCKKMDLYTFSNKTISRYINENFYAVKLNGEGKKNITFNGHTFKFHKEGRRGYHELSAALMNGKLSYPTTIFLSEEEELLDRIPGYLDTKTMEKILAYFSKKNYQTSKWAEFNKNFKSQL
jgi:thioredoxin-related protein